MSLPIHKTKFELLIQEGETYLENEQVRDAIRIFEQIVLEYPDQVLGYHKLGTAYLKIEEWKLAINAYEKAVELDYTQSEFYGGLGLAWLKLENWKSSILAYEKALQILSKNTTNSHSDPLHCWYYHYLGDNLLQLERWDEAIRAYEEAIRLEPNSSWSYHNQGLALLRLERLSEALPCFERSVELTPCDWFCYNWGDCLEKMGKFEDAIIAFSEAINFHPQCLWYYDRLSQVFIKSGQWKEAIFTLIKALKIKPDLYFAYLKIKNILEEYDEITGEEKTQLEYCQFPSTLAEKWLKLPEHWSMSVDVRKDIKLIPIYEAESFHLESSKSCHPTHCLQKMEWVSDSTFLAIIPQGKAWGDEINSTVLTSDHQVIRELSTGTSELVISSLLPPVEYLDETVAFLSIRWGGVAYFHWMFDVLTRLELIRQSGISLETIDKFVVNCYQKNYEKETLQSFGIPPEKIIESSVIPYIQAKTLLIPSRAKQEVFLLSEWGCEFLRREFLKTHNYDTFLVSSKRIYISRKKTNRRRITNEEEVLKIIEKWGFFTLVLEDYSVVEQARYLAGAEVIIAPHGGGLTNLVFCQPGTKLIELFSPLYIPNCYWIISNLCQLEHYHLLGEMIDSQLHPLQNDIRVNLLQLESILQLALG